jgi:hypothetical protein
LLKDQQQQQQRRQQRRLIAVPSAFHWQEKQVDLLQGYFRRKHGLGSVSQLYWVPSFICREQQVQDWLYIVALGTCTALRIPSWNNILF